MFVGRRCQTKAAPDLELMLFIIIWVGGELIRELFCTYLLMRKAELVLQNLLPVRKQLHLICKDIKIISQSLDEFIIVNVVEWHDAATCTEDTRSWKRSSRSSVGCHESSVVPWTAFDWTLSAD